VGNVSTHQSRRSPLVPTCTPPSLVYSAYQAHPRLLLSRPAGPGTVVTMGNAPGRFPCPPMVGCNRGNYTSEPSVLILPSVPTRTPPSLGCSPHPHSPFLGHSANQVCPRLSYFGGCHKHGKCARLFSQPFRPPIGTQPPTRLPPVCPLLPSPSSSATLRSVPTIQWTVRPNITRLDHPDLSQRPSSAIR